MTWWIPSRNKFMKLHVFKYFQFKCFLGTFFGAFLVNITIIFSFHFLHAFSAPTLLLNFSLFASSPSSILFFPSYFNLPMPISVLWFFFTAYQISSFLSIFLWFSKMFFFCIFCDFKFHRQEMEYYLIMIINQTSIHFLTVGSFFLPFVGKWLNLQSLNPISFFKYHYLLICSTFYFSNFFVFFVIGITLRTLLLSSVIIVHLPLIHDLSYLDPSSPLNLYFSVLIYILSIVFFCFLD